MRNLVQETKASLSWVKAVLGAFIRVRPATTLALIGAIALKNVFSLLAGFLPLKVILLAGSDGVPRYFQFFIPADADKTPWILGFTLAAVVSFILKLVTEAAAKRLSAAGSHEVLQGANEMAVASKQREEAGGYFSRFSEVAANVLILLFALAALAVVNLPVFFTLASLLLLEYLFTAGVIAFTDPLKPGRIRGAIQSRPRNYITLLSSINFLACFFVLLIPFLTQVGGNLLLAILSLLLIGQASNAVRTIALGLRSLWNKRAAVDPLVFREERIRPGEKPVVRDLRLMFAPGRRAASVAARLRNAGWPVQSIESRGQDSGIRGAYSFHLEVETRESTQTRVRHLQQQVFPLRLLHLLEHEEFLFTKISRESVHAPEVIVRYDDEPFTCQLCDYGSGQIMDAEQWETRSLDLLTELWSLEPPAELLAAYRTAQPGLEARLLPEFLQRLEVAIESNSLRRTYENFLDRLPELQSLIAAMPLHLHNPDMGHPHVALTDDDRPLIMTWTRWELVPLGSALPPKLDAEGIERMLEQIQRRRPLAPGTATPAHLRLVSQCQHIEKAIQQDGYRSALNTMAEVLQAEWVPKATMH